MIKLNIGSGLDYKEGYINIDGSDLLDKVDKIINFNSDSLTNHFKLNSVDYILANDFIEHFYHWEAVQILKDFYKVLKPEGEIEIRVPDIKFICSTWRMNIQEKITYLYGGQDIDQGEKKDSYREKYPHFFCHKYGYTQKSMKIELLNIGFSKIVTKNKGRNFIAKASKPDK